MDIEFELRKENSKATFSKVAKYVGNDSLKFKLLMNLFLNSDIRLAQRASNPVSLCIENYPYLLNGYYELVISLLNTSTKDTIKRNIVRFLQFAEIPESYMGEIAELCFSYLADAKEAIAIRVFSMTVLFNISKVFPELKEELFLTISNHLPYGSAGFKSRGSKILKELSINS